MTKENLIDGFKICVDNLNDYQHSATPNSVQLGLFNLVNIQAPKNWSYVISFSHSFKFEITREEFEDLFIYFIHEVNKTQKAYDETELQNILAKGNK